MSHKKGDSETDQYIYRERETQAGKRVRTRQKQRMSVRLRENSKIHVKETFVNKAKLSKHYLAKANTQIKFHSQKLFTNSESTNTCNFSFHTNGISNSTNCGHLNALLSLNAIMNFITCTNYKHTSFSTVCI